MEREWGTPGEVTDWLWFVRWHWKEPFVQQIKQQVRATVPKKKKSPAPRWSRAGWSLLLPPAGTPCRPCCRAPSARTLERDNGKEGHLKSGQWLAEAELHVRPYNFHKTATQVKYLFLLVLCVIIYLYMYLKCRTYFCVFANNSLCFKAYWSRWNCSHRQWKSSCYFCMFCMLRVSKWGSRPRKNI